MCVKAPSLLSLAILLGIAVVWRSLSTISSLGVQMGVVGEGPHGSGRRRRSRTHGGAGVFAACTFPSRQGVTALLVLCRVTCRTSGNMEVVGR